MDALNKQILIVNSITHAYRARDYLYNKGIKVYIERVPPGFRYNGCGYGIRVNNDASIIADMLDDAGIRVKEIINL